MPVQQIAIPDSIKEIELTSSEEQLIDDANDRLEAFLLADQEAIENFVTCDFHLVAKALHWIDANHLLSGRRFCELGSGFGVCTMLAAHREMESVGIEIEPVLVSESNRLAEDLDVAADFFCGSFVPRGVLESIEFASEIENVSVEEGDVYREIGLAMDDFDLFFAFPWPGEHVFFESVFDQAAADGALLMTYRGRDGMNLVQKV